MEQDKKATKPGKKYGIYNTCAGEFQFTDICEDTKGRAMRKLFKENRKRCPQVEIRTKGNPRKEA